MKPKILAKILVDLTMMVLLLFQMGYHLWGERNHEWTGAFLFLLFVIHQILNRQWYKNLPWGKYGLMRVLTLMVDLLVLAAMAAQLYSGVVLSRYIFRFLPIHRGDGAGPAASYPGGRGYLFIGAHLGLHWGMLLGLAKRHLPAGKGTAPSPLLFLAGLLAAGYGALVLQKRNLADNLFLRTEFVFLDYEEPRLLFLLDYLALMALCVFVAHYLVKGLRLLTRRKEWTE